MLYGNYAKQLMIEEGIPEHKLAVIYNSLNYAEHLRIRNSIKKSNIYTDHFGNKHPVIVFIGRLTKGKRLDLIIQTVHDLNKTGLLCNAVLVGDGIAGKELKDLAKSLNVENQIWFYGASYNEQDNANLIYNGDICLSPGNVGLTAIHSLSFGTPVITHDSFPYQNPEFEAIKPGRTGDFFKKDDLSSMEEVVRKWLSKVQNERDSIREWCYAEIDKRWNPDVQIEILHNLLDK